ncbi:MAG: alpha-ketoglutarate-dependent dioxygenase AlkB, partial [Moritella sp.]|uniref:alpha-ketoglutarate-dependent dioxygenase AlkB n=1 Tax=Moritella sp. TaxID=78556 RepID=UPI001D5A8BCF
VITAKINQTITEQMNEMNKSNEFIFKSIKDQICRLETLTADVRIKPTAVPDSSDIYSRSTSSPAPASNNPPHSSNLWLEPYVDVIPEFISDDCAKLLNDYVHSIDSEFENIGERSMVYFGDYDYHYTGKTHNARTPPPAIQDLISSINTKFPNKQVNSCLISKYVNGEQSCPPHEDNEDEIDPESDIYTLSIGADRKMVFHNKADSQIKTVDLLACGLLVFSRISQEVWKHSIPRESEVKSVRYSFTFRMIAPYFVNSTVICGDSNTEKLQFGDSPETFGKWMPGRRITSYKVEEIPTPYDIGPHKNIVLHVGVNDIKFVEHSRVTSIINTLEVKCNAIINAFPRSNVYICPILPTKDPNMIPNVFSMNEGITELAKKYANICLMENYYGLFSDSKGVMKAQVGKYYKGKPNDRDFLHLGGTGIKLLAGCIKHCVLKRKGSIFKDNNIIDNPVTTNTRHHSSGENRSPQARNYARALNHNLRFNDW